MASDISFPKLEGDVKTAIFGIWELPIAIWIPILFLLVS